MEGLKRPRRREFGRDSNISTQATLPINERAPASADASTLRMLCRFNSSLGTKLLYKHIFVKAIIISRPKFIV